MSFLINPYRFASTGSAIPTDYLAYYPMNAGGVSGSTLLDMSGNGYNGTIVGATQTGDYLSFDGVNDAVTSISKFLSGKTEFTIAIDVMFNASSGDYDIFIVGGHAGSAPFALWYDEAATDVYSFLITDSSTNYSGVLSSNTSPAISTWQKLILTFSGGNEMRLYIDGSEDANSPFDMSSISDVTSTVPAAYKNEAAFGYNGLQVSPIKYLNGRLRNARFYERVINSGEITAIFNE